MRLAKLSEFRSLVYTPESAPSLATLRARIKAIPGGTMEHGHYYVDLDEYDRKTNLRAGIESEREELAKDLRLAGLL